ncbi:flavin-containing monooxygenase [Stakelama tenebrarum]|uniref:NAD(P)/FAD-dependent oxidoreductase n=1 Tax=Stakelama tenebrarum TaxID=2711215 RepID=A0A6G6Y810_9SPHN|nr:NAD(P)/FAD-dependent oxidoreductase [Sphingosinithalassobacter tenebrarum]QIG80848.1 NAD(P)/FAD-dependent oxidoreductase [Sphingosinithalassobacter tenebrarum]
MGCEPTQVRAPEEIDIPAMRDKYRAEREKRLRSEGQKQYVRPTGEQTSDFAADPHKPVEPRDPVTGELEVVVLGAGFGGLLASYHLTQAGITDFRNIDSAGDFGGVWYWNRYPGIQCDNDAYCYLPLLEEMGFMPSKKFADGAEIYGYCKMIAEKTGFADRALFHTLTQELRWDPEIQRWHVKTNRGDDIKARHVIVAAGVLNMPKLPGIKGIDVFQGKMFHTARWDYGYTGGTPENPVLDKLADKTVAIVGTGATAIQAVPRLAQYAKQLYVVQRTPSSVDERPNPPTDPEWQRSLKPGWQAERMANFHKAAMETLGPGDPDLICDIWTEISRNLKAELEAEGWPELSVEEFMARRETVDYQVMDRLRRRVEEMVQDPETAEALKPYYRFLCKRPLSSNEYYPAFNKPNVELVDVSETKGLQELTEGGFIANGKEYQADCVIFASGFEVTSDLERRWGMDVVAGRDGRSIYDHWRDGPLTLHGTMTHGFPNMYFVGYIQGGLNATVTEQFGRQGEHIAHIISETAKRGAKAVEPTKEAQDDYVRTFEALEIDLSEFQSQCPPSYFNNEGEKKPKWALFRGYGPGWDAFQKLCADWRADGEMTGLTFS